MSCKKNNIELLYALADHELSPEEAKKAWQHVDQCESCQRALEEIKQIKLEIGKMPEIEVPYGFSGSVMKRLGESSPNKKKRAIYIPRFAAIAAALILVVSAAARMGLLADLGISLGKGMAPSSDGAPLEKGLSVAPEDFIYRGNASICKEDESSPPAEPGEERPDCDESYTPQAEGGEYAELVAAARDFLREEGIDRKCSFYSVSEETVEGKLLTAVKFLCEDEKEYLIIYLNEEKEALYLNSVKQE